MRKLSNIFQSCSFNPLHINFKMTEETYIINSRAKYSTLHELKYSKLTGNGKVFLDHVRLKGQNSQLLSSPKTF